MTSGEPPAGPSAARLGGYALIGVGGLAAIFGVATLVSGGMQDAAQEPPPGATTSPPSSTAESPPPQPPNQPPAPPPAVQPPQQPGQQPPAETPPGTPGDAGKGTERVVVRVYNNSTIKGLAQRAADDFRRAGFDVPEVGNYSAGRIYTTTVYFRPGTEEEEQAKDIAAHFGARLEPRFEGIQSAKPGIIAIITNDYKGAPAAK